MRVVREGQEKGSSRSVAVLSTSSFQAAGGSKDTKQAPAPRVSVAAAGQALLPSCGEQDRGTAEGPRGPGGIWAGPAVMLGRAPTVASWGSPRMALGQGHPLSPWPALGLSEPIQIASLHCSLCLQQLGGNCAHDA